MENLDYGRRRTIHYPELSKEGQERTKLIIDKFRKQIEEIANDTLVDFTDTMASYGGNPVIANAWISVKERLPNHRQKVLFCTKSDVQKAIYMHRMTNEHGDFSEVFLSTDGGHYELETQIITHWMPLPELPK